MDFRLPNLAAGMEVGTVLSWLKQQGDQVAEGEPIVEVEADKANHELEAPASGTLDIVAAEGDEVEVGGLLARIE
jgi:pyruvate/2-oxoglutarate dehydrogenase complex dihydrolipoamide acyltransferase (E2) component